MAETHSTTAGSSWRQYFQIPFHPFLVGLLGPLSMLAQNIGEISPETALRSFIAAILITFVLYLLLRVLLKDWQQAAIMASAALILFYSYGHLYDIFGQWGAIGITLRRHRLLGPVFAVLCLGILFWIRRLSISANATQTLNVVALAMLALPTWAILSDQLPTSDSEVFGADEISIGDLDAYTDKADLPDVYYIVLDAYSREDMIQHYYGYDNGWFVEALRDRGFYVANCSMSNYSRTYLSLASSLHMAYIQGRMSQEDFQGFRGLIHNNPVRTFFEELDYKVIAFETGFSRTEWRDADLYLSRTGEWTVAPVLARGVNGFELILLRSTAARILLDLNILLNLEVVEAVEQSPDREHYLNVHYTLRTLESLPSIPGHKLVFAHVLSPHPPYVFTPEGAFDLETEPVPGYGNQLDYLNQQILDIVDNIQANSSPEPLIIIQGDHGGTELQIDSRRMPILNAYYFPNRSEGSLYSSITPVNSFRVLFNEYFNANLQLAPDQSYYSFWENTFDFEVVEDPSTRCHTEE